ncbi:ATP-binding cassette domain-containing protein [Candidatus Micrarchaeota archaeon]|nr:ATP-binding cassette domain-containing protein [Candidatus Micrarchaeota archaeon]
MSSFAIKVENLTKEFDGFRALDEITFSVKKGELFGLLGPNGAGKTTTLNILSTLLCATSGTTEVAGFSTGCSDEVRSRIGMVFQEPALDGELTGRENLEFHGWMYGMSDSEIRKRSKAVLELVELTDKADVLVNNYSGGMKRRLEIARGLMHEPEVLFLDEPTLGLDVQTRRHIWEYVKKLNEKEKVTIVLTTHYLEEADFLCGRVAIIDKGRIVALDSPAKLKDSIGGDVVSLEASGSEAEWAKALKAAAWLNSVSRHDGVVDFVVERGERHIPELLRVAQKLGFEVSSVTLHKPSLEDVFVHFTGKSIREQEASSEDRARAFARRHFRR